MMKILKAIYETLFASDRYNSTHIVVYLLSDGTRKTQKCCVHFVPSTYDINRVEAGSRCMERPMGYAVVGYFLLRAEEIGG